MKILTDQNFDNVVSKGVTLVDLWATWCAPCRRQAPIVEEIASELGNKAVICKMDVDQNPNITKRYDVQNIPTILIFKNGTLVQTLVGLQDKSTLLNEILKYLDK